MAKKRKSDTTRLDEVDRTIYLAFCGAANSLSQLYTQAMNTQRLSFLAGERHALEKLYQWILRQQEHGARPTATDIVTYLQNELECGAEEPPGSPNLDCTVSSSRSSQCDNINQGKSLIFSNALSGPVRKTLQHFHSVHAVNHPNSADSADSMDTNC